MDTTVAPQGFRPGLRTVAPIRGLKTGFGQTLGVAPGDDTDPLPLTAYPWSPEVNREVPPQGVAGACPGRVHFY